MEPYYGVYYYYQVCVYGSSKGGNPLKEERVGSFQQGIRKGNELKKEFDLCVVTVEQCLKNERVVHAVLIEDKSANKKPLQPSNKENP